MYLNHSINTSPTIEVTAGAVLTAPAMLALAYDADGNVKLPDAGVAPAGIVTADTDDVSQGERITIGVKDIVLWIAGGEVSAGDELSCDAAGKAVKSSAGQYIYARALKAASAAGDPISVQIINAGYKPAAS